MATTPPSAGRLKVMVLAGGPDRERPISLLSGAAVTASLAQAGHEVRQRDIGPDDLAALDEFDTWDGDVVFPMLHGSWGEGGGLQMILEAKELPFVGSGSRASALCMDKTRAKRALVEHKLPTPPFETLGLGTRRSLEPPVVVKAPREGSSIDLVICRTTEEVRRARSRLGKRHAELLVEKFIEGKELTVGLVGAAGGKMEALPAIHIVPATEFYDYEAKYDRDDTQYLFDIALPKETLSEVTRVSLEAARALGCQHFCRADLMVDAEGLPYILEINTIPGFTSHSLLPKAAAKAGMQLPQLVDRLARLAAATPRVPSEAL